MIDDLVKAQQILTQLRREELEQSHLQKMLWGFILVEKELSCYRDFDLPEKIRHLEKAERYMSELDEHVPRDPETGLRVHIKLEQEIIKGRKALLDFRGGADMDNVRQRNSEAVKGIERALKKLRKVDRDRFKKVEKYALEERDKLSEAGF